MTLIRFVNENGKHRWQPVLPDGSRQRIGMDGRLWCSSLETPLGTRPITYRNEWQAKHQVTKELKRQAKVFRPDESWQK